MDAGVALHIAFAGILVMHCSAILDFLHSIIAGDHDIKFIAITFCLVEKMLMPFMEEIKCSKDQDPLYTSFHGAEEQEDIHKCIVRDAFS